MKVKAVTRIKHDGDFYEIGDTLDVNKDQAAKLLAANAIEDVKGVKAETPEPVTDTKSLGEKSDKSAESKGVEEVSNLPIKITMSKEKLIGVARANGLEVEKSAVREEVYEMIKDYRIKKNIVIKGDPKTIQKEAKAGKKKDSKKDTSSK